MIELIKPKIEVLTDKYDDLKAIELAARTCYKSEDKITDNSAKELVKKLIKRNHMAMLEFGKNYIFMLNSSDMSNFYSGHISNIDTNSRLDGLVRKTYKDGDYMISANIRTYMEIYNNHKDNEVIKDIMSSVLYYSGIDFLTEYGYPEPKLVYHNIDKERLTQKEKNIHCTETIKFIVNRGVSHELVRHRLASFAQESTRYVNYNKKNKGSISIIDLGDLIDNRNSLIMQELYKRSADAYNTLIEEGVSPQIARNVLPVGLKTEIVVKTNINHWFYILNLRNDKAAHPQMQEVMKYVSEYINSKYNNDVFQ